jgi:hypothetical protein
MCSSNSIYVSAGSVCVICTCFAAEYGLSTMIYAHAACAHALLAASMSFHVLLSCAECAAVAGSNSCAASMHTSSHALPALAAVVASSRFSCRVVALLLCPLAGAEVQSNVPCAAFGLDLVACTAALLALLIFLILAIVQGSSSFGGCIMPRRRPCGFPVGCSVHAALTTHACRQHTAMQAVLLFCVNCVCCCS